MIIAFSGNDGSGKSTLAGLLAADLEDKGRRVLVHEEFGYLPLRIMRRLAQRRTKRVQSDLQKGASAQRSFGVMSYALVLSSAAQILWLRTFRRGQTVIKDRCVFDYLATARELGVNAPLLERLSRFAPKPDITFYISVEPEVAMHRRNSSDRPGNKTLDFYQQKRKIYDRIYNESRIFRIYNDHEDPHLALTSINDVLETRDRIKRVKTIAISGLDGSGKSTTTAQLSEALSRLNLKSVVVHFYYQYLVLKVIQLLKRQTPPDELSRQKESVTKEVQHLASGKSKMWMAFVLFDAALQYMFYRTFMRKHIVVFDRYFHDYVVSFEFLKLKFPKERLLRFFPRPDRHFLQIADFRVLHQRKPEHTIEFFESCHRSYCELGENAGMIILDSTKSGAEEITSKLLAKL